MQIAQGKAASIVNAIYMIGNIIVTGIFFYITWYATSYYTTWDLIQGVTGYFVVLNLPNFIQIFTQIMTFLYIYEANEGQNLVT